MKRGGFQCLRMGFATNLSNSLVKRLIRENIICLYWTEI